MVWKFEKATCNYRKYHNNAIQNGGRKKEKR